MGLKTLNHLSHAPIGNANFNHFSSHSTPFIRFHPKPRIARSILRICLPPVINRSNRLVAGCISPSQELVGGESEIASGNGHSIASVLSTGEEEEEVEGETGVVEMKREEPEGKESLWNQIVEIMKFSGPATGLWICGPLMSLIDTAVIGQGSSLKLAALGPATVLCDYTSYIFMFLSIATSNMVATSLARQNKDEVQHQISILLFIGLTCGVGMLFCTRFLGAWALTAFTGPKNVHIIPAANTYVQIRSLAWPAVLVGWVAQSASLGMKDSWGPLKALAVASVVNGIGDIVLCTFLGYGIAGAAWATMVSQVIAGYMMIETLNKKGYNAFALSVPSPSELLQVFMLAAPVFITMISKVAFYSLIVYFATSMGTHTVAAHQVMIQLFSMCAVFGEPLSQTAQSFMPELMYGVNRSLPKARSLLKSLLIFGALSGLIMGSIGASIPLLFPKLFSPDPEVIGEMRKVLIPYLMSLCVTASVHSLEGTLLAGRDLKFLSLSMSGCFSLGALFLMLVSGRGFGLAGCWCALVGFQWSRFFMALRRLLSPDGILYSEDLTRHQMGKLKAV
ncbi:protein DETOXIFICATION 46, chloroplastic-like [Rhododendron vialii]|uniref:protein DETOXIFICATION 46, chloroplastic-like n=1 Tax=Rhododendron vialii TaxID=182163 RepID=UPI00265EBC6D|nr:protein DETOXIFICATION 46, chloroplastic-like [Rhododendron vialii]